MRYQVSFYIGATALRVYICENTRLIVETIQRVLTNSPRYSYSSILIWDTGRLRYLTEVEVNRIFDEHNESVIWQKEGF